MFSVEEHFNFYDKNFSTASKMTVSSVNQAVPSGNAEDPSLIWNALTSNFSEAVLTSYTISDQDVAGPFDKRSRRQPCPPRGNATGINFLDAEVAAKRLALLHELVPKAVRIAVVMRGVTS